MDKFFYHFLNKDLFVGCQLVVDNFPIKAKAFIPYVIILKIYNRFSRISTTMTKLIDRVVGGVGAE